MGDEKEVIDYLRRALRTPLVPQDEITIAHRFLTPANWYSRQPTAWRNEQSRLPLQYSVHWDSNRIQLANLIRRGFGHVAANPSDRGNVIAHERTYTLARGLCDEASQLGMGVDVVNLDAKSVGDFIQQLSLAAKESGDLYRERHFPSRSDRHDYSTAELHQSPRSKWVLLGERGVGKTAFLNYLLATKTPYLHEKRVIWVRLDLTKVYDERLSLEQCFHWQALQILYRYYDQTTRNSAIHNFGAADSSVFHWVEKQNHDMIFDLSGDNAALYRYAKNLMGEGKLEANEFRARLNNARVMFLRNEAASVIEENWIFPSILDYLVLEKNVSFLFILDGLDQLGLSNGDKKRFDHWMRAVEATVLQEGSLPGAYLVTMRYQSWNHHLTEEHFRRSFKPVTVAPVPSKDIWYRKLEYLKDHGAFSLWNLPKRLSHEKYAQLIDDFCTAYMEFVSYSLSVGIDGNEARRDISAGFQTLDEIFGSNRRKVFEALSNTVDFFIRILPDTFDKVLDRMIAESAKREVDDKVDVNLAKGNLPDALRYQYLFIEGLMLENPSRSFREPRYFISTRPDRGKKLISLQQVVKIIYSIFFQCRFLLERNVR